MLQQLIPHASDSVPINSEMEMVRAQSALNVFTLSQIHMKSTGGVGSLDMDSTLRSFQLFRLFGRYSQTLTH